MALPYCSEMPWHPEEQLGTGWTLTASATPPFASLGVRFASDASGFILSRRIDNGFVWCFAPCGAFSLPKYAHAWPSGEALRPTGSGASGLILFGLGWEMGSFGNSAKTLRPGR